MKTLKSYLTIQEAAEVVGVSPKTLRRWDNLKKFPSIRNPLNGYRLYEKDKLQSLLKEVGTPPKNTRRGSTWTTKH
ncbi:MAG: MerR family DNA-binding transcriptional regulator [Elusimicrobia bacterium]|nr:MerR family DNA-binding transcriptional regulator [Candidatus Obscuribacterium magneticum]